MKLFLARTVNLLLIGALLLGYQYQAGQRADAVADYQEQVKAAQTEQVQEGQAQAETGPYQNGVFTGKGTGFQGELTVQMTVEQGWITSLEVLETADDPEYVKRPRHCWIRSWRHRIPIRWMRCPERPSAPKG